MSDKISQLRHSLKQYDYWRDIRAASKRTGCTVPYAIEARREALHDLLQAAREAVGPTREEVSKAIVDLANRDRGAALEVLQVFGATTLIHVPEEKWPALLECMLTKRVAGAREEL